MWPKTCSLDFIPLNSPQPPQPPHTYSTAKPDETCWTNPWVCWCSTQLASWITFFFHIFSPKFRFPWISRGNPSDGHHFPWEFPWDSAIGGGSAAIWALGWAPRIAAAARGATGDGWDTKAAGDPQFGDAGGGAFGKFFGTFFSLFFFVGLTFNHSKKMQRVQFVTIYILQGLLSMFFWFGIVAKCYRCWLSQ